MNNIRQIGLATLGYESINGVFPPISTWALTRQNHYQQQYSVFARILMQLDQPGLYHALNFSPALSDPYLYGGGNGVQINATVMAVTIGFLICPSDRFTATAATGPTNYRASIGHSVNWINDPGPRQSAVNSPFNSTAAATTDGLSNTSLFGEKLIGRVEAPSFDARLDMAKDFIVPDDTNASMEQCSAKTDVRWGFFTTAGLTWFVGTLSQTEYNHAFVPNSPISDCLRRGVVPPMGLITARSNHVGGVNIGMGDGSVRFITSDIAPAIWRAIGTRGGAEALTLP